MQSKLALTAAEVGFKMNSSCSDRVTTQMFTVAKTIADNKQKYWRADGGGGAPQRHRPESSYRIFLVGRQRQANVRCRQLAVTSPGP